MKRFSLAVTPKCILSFARTTWMGHQPFAIALAVLSFAITSHAATPLQTLGVYHWGGQYTRSVSQGVDVIADLGAKVVRIALSPRYYNDYNLGAGCYQNFSLATIARQPDVKAALDNKDIDVYLFTAYDGVTFGDCVNHNYLNPSFYTTSNTDAVIKEYSEFTLYLYQQYGRTHKRFIISNWESDNDVYCGAAYAYATNPAAKALCDFNYPAVYGGIRTPNDSLAGLTLWFKARRQGIEDGRQRALALGLGGTRVYFAPEFSNVRSLRRKGFKSVLYDVLPYVIFDYVSYSSYESINEADPYGSLVADLNTIRDVIGSDSIILGELGFSRASGDTKAVIAKTAQVLAAALAWGVAYAIQWNLYDQGTDNPYGLCDLTGQPTAVGTYYRELFKGNASVTGPERSFEGCVSSGFNLDVVAK